MKKTLLSILLILTFTLSACEITTSQTEDVLEKVRDELTIETPIEDATLPTIIDGVAITWDSNIDNTLSADNKLIQSSTDQDIKLTAYLSYEGRMLVKEFNITISAFVIDVTYIEYYSGAEGLSGDALKAFLYTLIKNHTELSYGDARDILQDTDEDPNNPDNIILLYTGNSISSTWDGGISWNREHVWPRSLGSMTDGDAEFSDLHHLRPTHPGVNSTRGNLEFDEGGNLVNNTTDCYYDGDSFEPRDEVKGDIARMIFYMAVRYEGENGEADLEVINQITGGGDTIGLLDTLLKWHMEDPVDDFERDRNDVIYSYQHNRNPFIDYPEFVELIWGN